MLQKALVLVVVAASIAGFVSCGSSSNHYVYAAISTANQIIAYREDPNSGELTEITGSPYTVGDGVDSLALHPSGKFLYAANPGQNENDISLFTISSDGTLNEVNPRTSVAPAASQPNLLVMDPAGSFLYVMNTASTNISVFSIDSGSGALSEVSGSPFLTGLPPLNMKLAPSGNFLYVTTSAATGQKNGTIEAFSVSAGVLQFIGSTIADGLNPNGLVIDPSGTHLYASNSGQSNSISIFNIDSTGALTAVQGSPIDDIYNNPISMILDPTGSFLYVANQSSNNVAVYSISSSTGVPVALTTSTSTFAFATEATPSFLAADPDGKYVFVGNQGSSGAGVQTFKVANGNLEPIFTSVVGNTPRSIAVLQ